MVRRISPIFAAADIKGREDVLKMGIGKYNDECRSIVMRYALQPSKYSMSFALQIAKQPFFFKAISILQA